MKKRQKRLYSGMMGITLDHMMKMLKIELNQLEAFAKSLTAEWQQSFHIINAEINKPGSIDPEQLFNHMVRFEIYTKTASKLSIDLHVIDEPEERDLVIKKIEMVKNYVAKRRHLLMVQRR